MFIRTLTSFFTIFVVLTTGCAHNNPALGVKERIIDPLTFSVAKGAAEAGIPKDVDLQIGGEIYHGGENIIVNTVDCPGTLNVETDGRSNVKRISCE